MDQRRWEDLDKDCLGKVFEKVDMESLLLDIPFVCKSWHKETLNPSCWRSLIFPYFEPEYPYDPEFPHDFDYPIYERFVSEFGLDRNRVSETAFIKFVVNRSQGNAVCLNLPGCSTVEAFEYVADACPNLVILGLPSCLLWKEDIDLEWIGKFKYLSMLSLGSRDNLDRVLAVVSKQCKLFSHLTLSRAAIGEKEVMAIVNLVPDIESLSLNEAIIGRDELIILLKGCKKLLFLDAKDCLGFNEGDDEIAELGSHISNFRCEGSTDGTLLASPGFFSGIDSSFMEDYEDYVYEMASMFAEVDVEAEVNGEGDGDIEESVEP